MKLISCDGCGVILNEDKLNFPYGVQYDEEGCIDDSKARYNQSIGEYMPYVPCPVCKHEVWNV